MLNYFPVQTGTYRAHLESVAPRTRPQNFLSLWTENIFPFRQELIKFDQLKQPFYKKQNQKKNKETVRGTSIINFVEKKQN